MAPTIDTSAGTAPRQSIFDRLRGPMTVLLVAAISVGACYVFFLQKKTEYYTARDARLIARAAQQITRSVTIGANIVKNAAALKNDEAVALYKIEGRTSDEQRLPSRIFKDITTNRPATELADELVKNGDHRYATRTNDGLLLNFDVLTKDQQFASGQIELQQFLKPLQRSMAGIFDTFFILDSSGDVIYQAQRAPGDESGSDMKVVRVQELTVSRTFEKAQTLKVAELMSVSRQMPIRLGDNDYQLFSVPIRSTVHVEDAAHQKSGAEKHNETWVVCGLVSTEDFRSRSLQISVTLLSCLAAAVLLVIFSWPFVKMAMTSAQNKTTLFDVILLGICGIFAAAIVSLAAVDWLTFDKLQHGADQQLDTLATDIEDKFNADVKTAIEQLDAVEPWALNRLLTRPEETRTGDLLRIGEIAAPLFQSIALIDANGMQKAKWSVDKFVPPLVRVGSRAYFSAPLNNGPDYLSFSPVPGARRRVTVESVRSSTTGQTEVVFSRAIGEMGGQPPPQNGPAVITISASSSLSVLNAVVPEDFGFAIIDANGKVLFHSQSERNSVENFFAESDQNPKLRAAVAARQQELLDLRYWGDDYRARVRPLTRLPWTLVTFREKSGLRDLNTEALLTAFLFLLTLHGGGLLLFICIVLVLRPLYRAAWLWPDPSRVHDYSDLTIAYVALLVAGACLIGAVRGGALVVIPFCFVPFVLMITYLHLRGTRRLRAKLFVAGSVVAAFFLIATAWRTTDGDDAGAVAAKALASILLLFVLGRAMLRSHARVSKEGARERQTALPIAYVSVAALLLLLVSVVPTIAFFKAAYEIQVVSYVKYTQIQLARSLQNRWWRLSGEFSKERGDLKENLLKGRWRNLQDLHYDSQSTSVGLRAEQATIPPRHSPPAPLWLESILPTYSEASVNTRALLHDGSADNRWGWTRDGALLRLTMRNADPVPDFAINSLIPAPFPTLATGSVRMAVGAVSVLLTLALVLAIAEFIARRVFLVDVVHPLWLARGFLGLRHVICHPCDDVAVQRLFRDFMKLDLKKESDLDLADTAPQSFPTFAPTVFIDHLGYDFATGERAGKVRALLERLSRNPDRTIVIRPSAMGVITHAILQGQEQDAWARILSSFVWVNPSQISADKRGVTLSGAYLPSDETTPSPNGKKHWLKRMVERVYLATGFRNYFEQLADSRVVDRTIAAEIQGDPYLDTLIDGLESVASGRDRVLDEIGERAEEYYTALWSSCSASEKLVLMQVAQTGLVNGKARKEVRRLLARGLLRRDPQLRVMNETFRRFVCVQAATSSLARQLEADLATDAWNRFRMPFFAAVIVVLLFFFGTQRELFDSTFAVVGGLTATIPALLKMLSAFGERGAAKAA